MTASTAALVSGVLGLIVAGWSIYTARITSREQDDQARKAEAAQQELVARTNEIAKLNAKIATMAEESLAQITGGDSYLLVEPFVLGDHLWLSVLNLGRHPLYDVQLTIDDGVEVRRYFEELFAAPGNPAPVSSELERRSRRVLNLGTVAASANVDAPALHWSMDGIDERTFHIGVIARNGATVEHIRLKKVENPPAPPGVQYVSPFGIAVALEVIRGNAVIYSKGLDKFVGPDGKPVWDLPYSRRAPVTPTPTTTPTTTATPPTIPTTPAGK